MRGRGVVRTFFAVSALGNASPAAPQPGADASFSFAVVSDPHVGAGIGEENLARLAGEANRERYVFTIVCGDLTEKGLAPEYERYARATALFGAPVHSALGNHDTRWCPGGRTFAKRFLGIERPYRSFDHEGWHFVILDSTIVGEAHGMVDATQRAWLEEDLGRLRRGTPVVAALHHPPAAGNARHLAGEEELLETFRRHGVRLVLVGHGHSMRTWRRDGVRFVMTASFYGQRPGYRVARVQGRSLAFETRRLGSRGVQIEETIEWDAPADPSTPRVRVRTKGDDVVIELAKAADPWLVAGVNVDGRPVEPPRGDARPGRRFRVTLPRASLAPGRHRATVRFEGSEGATASSTSVFENLPSRWKGWRVPTEATSIRGAAIAEGKVFVAGTEGILAAHDLATGRALPSIPLGSACHGGAAASAGIVLAATEAGAVTAFGSADLGARWSVSLESPVVAALAAFENRLAVGDAEGVLRLLDLEDGSERWSFAAEGLASPAAVSGPAIVAGNWDGFVYARERETGRRLWSFETPSSFYFAPGTSRPTLAGDVVVVTCAPPTRPEDAPGVYALRIRSGEVAWSLRAASGYCSPLALEDRVILTEANGRVLAIAPADGKVLWHRDAGAEIFDASPTACPGGFVFGTLDGELRFHDAANGEERGRFRIGDGFLFAKPAVSGDQVVVPDAATRTLWCVPAP